MTRRHWALMTAALLYALFSSPTPDTPGPAEIGVIFLLVFAAMPPRRPENTLWPAPLALLLAYGAMVPTLLGLFAGHAATDMLRDMVAFAALGLPLLYAAHYPAFDARAQKTLLAMLLGIGMVFAARYLLSTDMPLATLMGDPDLLYLANSPLVAFAAAWLFLRGCFQETKYPRAVAYTMLSLIPVAAMAAMMQRATLALLVLAWLGFFIATLIKNPKRAGGLALAVALLLACLWPVPQTIVLALYDKTMNVGWNARGAEIAVLLAQADGNIVQAIFGAGWGSLFKSPAVGDLWVRFSHALLTSLLWKTGWLGLALGCAALGALILAAWQRLRHDMVTFTALMLPLLPAMVLYGSYKSLCFGFLLLGFAQLTPAILDKAPPTV